MPLPQLEFDVASTRRALDEARALLASEGPASAVDRVHTAVHGYLRGVLSRDLNDTRDLKLTQTYRDLRKQHPAFKTDSTLEGEGSSIVKTLANVIEQLNSLRNNASSAHPNPALEEPEANLALNAGVTLLQYVDEKRSAYFARNRNTSQGGYDD